VFQLHHLPVASPLTVAVEESDGTLRLRLAGDFDAEGVGTVEHALDRLGGVSAPRRVVLDLRGLAFLDVAGLRTILRADARGRAEAFEVVLVRPRGSVNRIFTLTRAGERLNIIDEPESTIAIFERRPSPVGSSPLLARDPPPRGRRPS
jgi:anti-anti-sigma factor